MDVPLFTVFVYGYGTDREIVEKADKAGEAVFLEASPAGAPIYRKYGFKDVYTFVVDLRGKKALVDEYEELFMLREPQPTS